MGIQRGGGDYYISAQLVHITISTILAAIVSIGGYMAIWAVNDARVKTKMDQRMMEHERRLAQMEQSVSAGILPRADERLRAIEQRIGIDRQRQ